MEEKEEGDNVLREIACVRQDKVIFQFDTQLSLRLQQARPPASARFSCGLNPARFAAAKLVGVIDLG